MKNLPVALIAIAMITLVVGGWRVCSSAADRVQQIPDSVTDPAPTISPPLVMQTKLATTQRVLEGLLNRDFAAVESSARILGQLAEMAPTRQADRLEDRIYEHFRTEFVRLSHQLESMGRHENLEGAAYTHQILTATCIACHNHLRDKAAE